VPEPSPDQNQSREEDLILQSVRGQSVFYFRRAVVCRHRSAKDRKSEIENHKSFQIQLGKDQSCLFLPYFVIPRQNQSTNQITSSGSHHVGSQNKIKQERKRKTQEKTTTMSAVSENEHCPRLELVPNSRRNKMAIFACG
jgi:hypothetical protein